MLDLATLAALYQTYRSDLSHPVTNFRLGKVDFDFKTHTYLMGVINLSAESWYRESVVLNAEAAIQRGQILQAQGASLVDLGAESSLAHAARVGEAQQKSLLIPVIKELSQSGLIVSVETYHPSVTTACLQAGALVINLTGTQSTEAIYKEIAVHQAGVIICYVEGKNVREVTDFNLDRDPIGLLYEYFAREVEKAVKAGVTRIWMDPGLGFYYRNLQDSALRIRHQIQIFLQSFRLRSLGWPICQALPHAFECFEDEVRSAESFFAVLAVLGQNNLLRTHEVSKVRGVLRTMNLMQNSNERMK